jgi:N-acyl homoserine lactone hydrolase
MKGWQIRVLYYGKIQLPKSALSPGLDVGLIIDAPYLGFLLQSGSRNILVDTGPLKQGVSNKGWAGYPADIEAKALEKALCGYAISPGEIDTVLFTHLHRSHAGNLQTLAKAQFIFQEDEWLSLLDPLSLISSAEEYDPSCIDILKSMNCLKVEGDLDLGDGIRIIKTPGHTPGSQSILVQTPKGGRIIVGDHWPFFFMTFPYRELLDLYGNRQSITPPPATVGGYIPSNLVFDYRDYVASSQKIRALMGNRSDCLLPGHESSLLLDTLEEKSNIN